MRIGSWGAVIAMAVVAAACASSGSTNAAGSRGDSVARPGGELLTETTSPEGMGQVESTIFAESLNVRLPSMTKLPTGIYYRDIEEGTGVAATPGREVLMTYIAYLADGTEVDRTRTGQQPLAFKVGAGTVIRGWDLGVRGMKTGGTRQLVVPARFAYGNRVVGKVPANSVMVFYVRLDGVR